MHFSATHFSVDLLRDFTSLLKVTKLQDLFVWDVACSIHQRSIILLKTPETLKEEFAVVSVQTKKLAIAFKVARKEVIWRVF